MVIHTYNPKPPLSDFVDIFWYSERGAPLHAKERCLPTGTLELVINLREDKNRIYDRMDHDRFDSYYGALICGAHSKYFIIDSAPQDEIIGVHFKPGGAYPFLDLPVDELHNTHLSLDELWGAAAGELREQLLEAATLCGRFRILEQALFKQAIRYLARHPAIAFALNQFQTQPHILTISDIVEQTGYSQRRFIELFRREVGMTPKMYCRVRRFQEALRQVQKQQRVEWVGVALDCGYYDQAHFIHDFQAFSGLNPTSYLTQRGDHFNHVPIS